MAQSDDLDLYAVLGVAENASDADIRSAYKREALKWHPDKVKGDADPAEAEARFKAINHAFSTLSDPDRRADYDAGGVGDADVRRHEEMARAFWEEIMREDARVREARIRKERRFVRKAAAFGVWVVALTSAVNVLGAESPLFFPTPLEIANRDLGAFTLKGSFRDFTQHLMAAHLAGLPSLERAAASVVRTHTPFLRLALNASQPDVRKPPTSTRPKAVLVGSRRRVGARTFVLETLVHPLDPRRPPTPWPPRDGVICAALLKSYTASKETWHDELKAAVERDSSGRKLRPFALVAADASECRASVGLVAVAGVALAAALAAWATPVGV